MNDQEMRERQHKMFGGVTASELKASKPAYQSDQLYAMSILSDVQEYMELGAGDKEVVRQMINRAKFFISESMGVVR